MFSRITSVRPPQIRNRFAIIASTLLVAFVLLLGHAYRCESRRQWLLSEIRRCGGVAVVDDKSLWEQLKLWYAIGSLSEQPPTVLLRNDRLWRDSFDDAWIQQHDYLRGLEIEVLVCNDVTGGDLAKLIDSHPLESLDLNSSLLSDDVIAAIGRKPRLKSLFLPHSNLNDAWLAALPLEQFELLYVTASEVTPAGLMQLIRCRRLQSVSLDADQLTAETAQVLASLGTVKEFRLAGVQITDVQLELLQQISTLEEVHLVQARTTAAGEAAFAAALPACRIDRRFH